MLTAGKAFCRHRYGCFVTVGSERRKKYNYIPNLKLTKAKQKSSLYSTKIALVYQTAGQNFPR
jgi:hypothetical protein